MITSVCWLCRVEKGGSFICRRLPWKVMSQNTKSQHADSSSSFLSSSGQVPKTEPVFGLPKFWTSNGPSRPLTSVSSFCSRENWTSGSLHCGRIWIKPQGCWHRRLPHFTPPAVALPSSTHPRLEQEAHLSQGYKSQGEQESWQKSKRFQRCRWPTVNYSEHKVQSF